MKKRKDRTLEAYMKAGAEMRLYKALGTKLAVDISLLIPAADTDKLLRAMRKIDEVCSNAEDSMFKDYPQIPNEYLDVFYGNMNEKPRNKVDEKVLGLAREAADGLFKGKRD